MKEPVKSDEALAAEIRAQRAATRDSEDFRLWWLGQSGFLLQWRGHELLFDPYLSESLTEKYASTDKPHVRITRRVIDPALLDGVEVVTSTHNHTDHLDAATLKPLIAANPNIKLVAPEANRAFVAQRLACDPAWPVGLDAGRSVTLGPWTLHGIAAAHESLDRDGHGRHVYLGYVVEFGRWQVYHSGDCVRYEGLDAALRRFDLDLAILPINGRAPERKVSGNFDGPEAAQLAKDARIRRVIPCHYDLFEFNTASPDAFVAACAALGVNGTVLQNGGMCSHP